MILFAAAGATTAAIATSRNSLALAPPFKGGELLIEPRGRADGERGEGD